MMERTWLLVKQVPRHVQLRDSIIGNPGEAGMVGTPDETLLMIGTNGE